MLGEEFGGGVFVGNFLGGGFGIVFVEFKQMWISWFGLGIVDVGKFVWFVLFYEDVCVGGDYVFLLQDGIECFD